MKKTLRLALIAVLTVFAVFASACSGEQDQQASSNENATGNTVIGVIDDSIEPVSLTNQTGDAVTSIQVKSSWSDGYDFTLEQSGELANGETATLYFPVEEIFAASEANNSSSNTTGSASSSSASSEASDIVLSDLADVKISLNTGKSYEMHQINLGDMSDATLNFDTENNMLYFVYVSKATDVEVNTLEAEIALQEQAKAEKAAKKAAEKKAKEEKAAKEEAARQKKIQEAAAAKKAQSASSTNGGSNSGSSNSDGEDACVSDLILN